MRARAQAAVASLLAVVGVLLAAPSVAVPVAVDTLGFARLTVGEGLDRDLTAIFVGDGLSFGLDNPDSAIAATSIADGVLQIEGRAAGMAAVDVVATDSAGAGATASLQVLVVDADADWTDAAALVGTWEHVFAGPGDGAFTAGLSVLQLRADGVGRGNTLYDGELVAIEAFGYTVSDSLLQRTAGRAYGVANGAPLYGRIDATPLPAAAYVRGDSLHLLAAPADRAVARFADLVHPETRWLTYTRSDHVIAEPPAVTVNLDRDLVPTFGDSALVLTPGTVFAHDLTATPREFIRVDDGPLIHEARVEPAGIVDAGIDADGLTLQALTQGAATLVLTASDSGGAAHSLRLPLRVNAVPSASRVPSLELRVGTEQAVVPAGWFTDSDDDVLSVTHVLDGTTSARLVDNGVVSIWEIERGRLRLRGQAVGSTHLDVTAADRWGGHTTVRRPIVVMAAVRGDFGGDGQVGLDDFFALAEAFGTASADMDLTGDGHVDLVDLFLFAELYGQ